MRLINPYWYAAGGSSGVTWNPADKGSDIVLSNGDLTAGATGTATAAGVRCTLGRATGKWYFELRFDTVNTTTNDPMAGVVLSTWSITTSVTFNKAGAWGVQSSPAFTYGNGSNQSTGGVTFAALDVLGVAVDLGTGNIWFAKNNAWILSGNPAAGTNATWSTVTGTVYPGARITSTSASVTARFASADLSYTPPAGFTAWAGS